MMSGSGSNSAGGGTSVSLTPRSKNVVGNRTNIGWKYGTDVLRNGEKVKCNYYSMIFNGGIFVFKHHLVGTRYDSEPCVSVSKQIKDLIIRVVSNVKDSSMKKRRLNNLEQIDCGEGLDRVLLVARY